MGLLLLLVSMFIIPAHNGMASDDSSMMMTMEKADGSPCPPKDCGGMPGCTMALTGGFGAFAAVLADVSSLHQFDVSVISFDFSHTSTRALFHGDGLRRPPKI